MLYAAYGMNTSKREMAMRCPAARAIGAGTIAGLKLVFRGVADVEDAPRSTLAVAFWSITRDCEEALDVLEDWRVDGSGLYTKQYRNTPHGVAMIYRMTRRAKSMPARLYELILREGYRDFGLPAAQIDHALTDAARAEAEQAKTWHGGSLWDYDPGFRE